MTSIVSRWRLWMRGPLFETGAAPLMAEVEFDDVSDVAVVGDVNGDTIVDSDSALLVDLVDFDEDPMASVDFSGLDV